MTGRTRATTAISGVPHDMSNYCIRRKIRQFSQGHRFVFFSVRSFKTKGNLTKHMKSKAHTKNYAASGSGSSTQQSGTQSSESDTEDSGMDSSGESSCVDVALISGSLARKLSLILTTINVNNGVIKPAGHRNSLRRWFDSWSRVTLAADEKCHNSTSRSSFCKLQMQIGGSTNFVMPDWTTKKK
jgi:hypothetical protein